MDLGLPLPVLVVAQDPLARTALARALGEEFRVSQAGVSDTASALGAARPAAVLWDLGLAPEPGLEMLLELSEDGELPPVVALVPEAWQAEGAFDAGARGVLPREAEDEALRAALQAVAGGLAVLAPDLLAELRAGRVSKGRLAEDLTPREREVLSLLVEGLSNKLVAARLGISEHTAKFHVNQVFQKLGVTTRTEAVVRAARLGLVNL